MFYITWKTSEELLEICWKFVRLLTIAKVEKIYLYVLILSRNWLFNAKYDMIWC